MLCLSDGCTSIEQLETDGDPDVEQFLRELARELGITNTLMFYERCFILVEGETEENALPILYRKIYGNSLLEDGIHINLKGNGSAKEFLKLLGRNRQELTIVFVDNDTQNNREAHLTEETLCYAGFSDDFIAERFLYVGDQEFEDAFSDAVISRCLQAEWPKSEGEWIPDNIVPLREKNKKFSKALQDLVWQNTTEDMPKWSKPIFGKELAQCCNDGEVPQAIQYLFEIARAVAGSD